ncbi:DNA-binding Lrp family transcriptional regulator [Leucobacter exalbidus]|uniref:DNA-binding Lrp family transcriptional regulator n=1 Tax=Leucobacter exalbidus TaxID=662960 RepID=A0A940PQ92_9MICO|nr:DNA-binding Lrp family transcriptional regulator [Leucobacter exalbidus]
MPNESRTVDEIDRQLVHALQIAPRISWAALGEIIGRSPAATAQRWQRLEAGGLAWLVAYESLGTHSVMAFASVTMDIDQRDQVIDALSAEGRVMAVSEGAIASRLHITVAADNLQTLIGDVLDHVAHIPGIVDVHARFVARLLAEGASWRLDALDPAQQRMALESADHGAPGVWKQPTGPTFDPDARELAHAFIRDPRSKVAWLADELGRHEATVRRQLSSLLQSGAVTVRCEMAYDVSGWPIERSWFLRVPDAGIAALTAVARDYRGLRLVALTIGDANIVITALSRTLEESVAFEAQLLGASAGVTVTESVLHLRTWKRMYRNMGLQGRSVWSSAQQQPAQPTL